MEMLFMIAVFVTLYFALPQLLKKSDSTEPANPIAEAEAYIAYGRTNQAKEILSQALKNNHPMSKEIQAKLDTLEKQ